MVVRVVFDGSSEPIELEHVHVYVGVRTMMIMMGVLFLGRSQLHAFCMQVRECMGTGTLWNCWTYVLFIV